MYHYEIIWLENCPLHFKLFTDNLLMTHSYCFDQWITLKSLKIISINNIKTKFTLEIEENGYVICYLGDID